ncbi:hypothetical protein CJ030_MR6G004336 [Morella rubra]|uniref:Uncharacterized protein n=1 Tax=Morella rubra TaxID=262757 RepID=A0A6A1VBB6_9ROSI|nr:hypothetical protein CJ030_MR6G004336 [Morella rubra]
MKSSWVKASSCSETDETTVALAPMGTLPVVALWVSNHTRKNLAELRLRVKDGNIPQMRKILLWFSDPEGCHQLRGVKAKRVILLRVKLQCEVAGPSVDPVGVPELPPSPITSTGRAKIDLPNVLVPFGFGAALPPF